MADKTPAEARAWRLNFGLKYKEPTTGSDLERLALSMFKALGEWNISLEHVSTVPFPANLAQAETTFQIMQGRFSVRVGLGSTTLTVVNPNWSEVETVTRVAAAIRTALRTGGEIELTEQTVSLEMHVTPVGRSIADLTAPLIPQKIAKSIRDDLKGFGLTLYRRDSWWQVDMSAMFPNSLYLQISHSFAPEAAFDDIASELRQEQDRVLEILALTLPNGG